MDTSANKPVSREGVYVDEGDRNFGQPYSLPNRKAFETSTGEKASDATTFMDLYCMEVDDSSWNAIIQSSSDEVPKVHTSAASANPSNHSQPYVFSMQTQHHHHHDSLKEGSSVVPYWLSTQPSQLERRWRNSQVHRNWLETSSREVKQEIMSNSTFVPLFEKMLSASDVGQTGRLVLPKACAEAYFPPISQPEGLPVTIQEFSGKDRVFQFRFWPNNNSRMYVLEGIAPCVQSVQLQAGDFVTFSRLDPEGKLVMGYRRAGSGESTQAGVNSTLTNSYGADSKISLSKLSKKALDSQARAMHKGPKTKGSSFVSPVIEKKKGRIYVEMPKQVQMDAMEPLEFRITWEEAQDLLQSPHNVTPSIVTVEGYEFEEFEEPPILCMTTYSATKSFRAAIPQPVQNAEVFGVKNVKDQKKKESVKPLKEVAKPLKEEEDLAGLEALANAATERETAEEISTSMSFPVTTTKHPRHRPGCTCIVCIQPPSGKGPKHHPACKCTVCATVRRRFTTLMERRKNRQVEHEAAEMTTTHKKAALEEDGGEVEKWKDENGDLHSNSIARHFPFALSISDIRSDQTSSGISSSTYQMSPCKESLSNEHILTNNAWIDLNVQPLRPSMMELLKSASYPLDMYMKEHKLSTLQVTSQQSSDITDSNDNIY